MAESFIEKQSKYWDSYNRGAETIDLVNIPTAEKIELEYLTHLAGDLIGKKVLDLGCGNGKFGLKLAKTAEEVVGIDISKGAVTIANATAKKYGISNFKAVVDDFKHDRYVNYFDLVLAINMFHHTDDLEIILGNILSTLKDEGRLIVFEVNPFNLLFIPFLISCGQIQSHLTKEYLRSNIFSLKRVLTQNGFRINEVNKWCLLPTVLYNRSLFFKKLNEALNRIPIVKAFCAFHVLVCQKG
ncbi:MAG: class I SAM-dependent methyltransferase [Patescibacteria group bacterium]|nr:class I SAM-dependent methyltransferase [Patescibacteria group bacterium]